MTQAVEVNQDTAIDPLARSGAYKTLSLAFRYPDAEMFEACRTGEFLTSLSEALSGIRHGKQVIEAEAALSEDVRREFEGMSHIDFEVKYNSVFEVGAPEPPCPPNEGVFRKNLERTAILIEVAEFYKQFGLGMSKQEGKRELPDHIVAELEFLHFLCFKEAQAREDKTPDLLKGYIHAQKDFLERHMTTWIPEFVRRLQEVETLVFFAGIGRILSRFVEAEHEYVTSLFEQDRG